MDVLPSGAGDATRYSVETRDLPRREERQSCDCAILRRLEPSLSRFVHNACGMALAAHGEDAGEGGGFSSAEEWVGGDFLLSGAQARNVGNVLLARRCLNVLTALVEHHQSGEPGELVLVRRGGTGAEESA